MRLLKLESELMLLIALPPRFKRVRFDNPDSALTSLIAFSFSNNASRFVKLEKRTDVTDSIATEIQVCQFRGSPQPSEVGYSTITCGQTR